MYLDRYIYDVLYGKVHYPEYVWKNINCPELQRLREVRLCNINSLCLTGGANINRFEHSLGTAYLALRCIESWSHKVDEKTKRRVILAALFHDVGSTAFGHSVQYVLDTKGYKHESLNELLSLDKELNNVEYNYQHTRMQPIFFGIPKMLSSMLSSEDLRAISEIIAGRGYYGSLINGCVDLDNIDNVYRLAYHIGLVRSSETPLALAESIMLENGQIVIEDNSLPMLQEWYEVRKSLYRYLLLNPDEFSAKCMLEEALYLAQNRSSVSFYWHDVDYLLLEKLAKCSDEISVIVSRLMVGDLYGCIGIYSTAKVEAYRLFTEISTRQALEIDLAQLIRQLKPNFKNSVIAFHAIKDVNKTQRHIKLLTTNGRIVEIGTPTHQLLIGVFFKNVNFSMGNIKTNLLEKFGVRELVHNWFKSQLKDPNIKELIPYGEVYNLDDQ